VKLGALLIAFVAGVAARPALYQIRDRMRPAATAKAAEPKDMAYYTQRSTHFADLKQVHPIVFLGDSRVQSGEWWELLGTDAANRGINGDTLKGVLDRIESSVPVGTRVCVVQVGFNDIAAGTSPADVAAGLTAIAKACPAARVVITSIIPATGHSAYLNSSIAEANRLAEDQVKAAGKEWLDISSAFGTELPKRFTEDGIHLNGMGYRHLGDQIKPALTTEK
ncbi:MAG: hypothetical protein EOP83_30345, partial [Verrucomicrobiaceae bacterium]